MIEYPTGGGPGTRSCDIEAVLGSVPDVVTVVSLDGALVWWNDALRTATGYGDDDLEGTTVDDLFDDGVGEPVTSVVQNGRSHVVEASLVAADGALIPYELSLALASAVDDDSDLIVIVGRDVSSREEPDPQLAALTTDLERLHRASTDLYAADSMTASFEVVIDAAVEILGFDWCTLASPTSDGEEFEIRAISREAPLVEGDRPFRVDEGIAGRVFETNESIVVDDARAVSASQPVSADIRAAVTVPVGDWGIFQAVSTDEGAFDDRDRQLVELLMDAVASTIDRCEREAQLRERTGKLERQNERLEEFTDVVSHDLRSPLTVLRGSLREVERTGDEEAFEHCYAAVERMDQLIEDLLTLAAEGVVIDEQEPVDLEAIARRCWHAVETADATVLVDENAIISADEGRLRQLLENLFRNAVEHGGEDVTVTVERCESGFAVEDDGQGIPEGDRERVFETGYTTGSDGTGLGLNIVAEVAEAHGWSVTVTDGEDGGCRFEIRGVEALE